jgi:hypothetical protein
MKARIVDHKSHLALCDGARAVNEPLYTDETVVAYGEEHIRVRIVYRYLAQPLCLIDRIRGIDFGMHWFTVLSAQGWELNQALRWIEL